MCQHEMVCFSKGFAAYQCLTLHTRVRVTAVTKECFYYPLICWNFLINRLVYKIIRKKENAQQNFLRVEHDVFRFPQTYSVHYNERQGILTFENIEPSNICHFCLKNDKLFIQIVADSWMTVSPPAGKTAFPPPKTDSSSEVDLAAANTFVD